MHKDALDKAKVQIMTQAKVSFFASVMFSIPIEWDESVPTAGVDGRKMYISPKFFMSLTEGQRVFLLLHETFHIAFKHILRKESRIHKTWNIATDYYINLELVKLGFELIDGALYETDYQGMSSEEIYNHLIDNPDEEPEEYSDDLMEPSEEINESEVDEILMRSAAIAERNGSWGTIPDEIKVYLKKINEPKLDWRTILWNHMTSISNEDYSWCLPNKVLLSQCYLPSIRSEGMGTLVFVIDVSGSTGPLLEEMVAEAMGMQAQFNPERIVFITFNTEIQDIYTFEQYEYIEGVEVNRGGGTNFSCVAEWIQENEPEVVVTFTDGWFSHNFTLPSAVIPFWIIYGDNRTHLPPQGTCIFYEE